jgi:uncharacterized protein (DUF433 family)
MSTRHLLDRITYNPEIFGGRAIIRGKRLAVSHVLEMMAAGSTPEELVREYRWLEPEDVQACLLYAAQVIGNEYFEPLLAEAE